MKFDGVEKVWKSNVVTQVYKSPVLNEFWSASISIFVSLNVSFRISACISGPVQVQYQVQYRYKPNLKK